MYSIDYESVKAGGLDEATGLENTGFCKNMEILANIVIF